TDGFDDELARVESLMYDAFDRADGAHRFQNEPGNSDVFRPQAANAALLEISPGAYLTNKDERVNLDGHGWRSWTAGWLTRGLKPSFGHPLGGLVDAMAAQGATWCDRCELLALHDKAT